MADSKINRIILMTITLIAVFLTTKSASAVSNLHGAAWWGSSYQYVYFDCSDHTVGDRLDVPGNFHGNDVPPGFKFFSSPCSTLPHHVSINNNGNFTGSAWNTIKGFITFDGTAPDYSFNTNCPKPLACTSGNNCLACYSTTTQRVYGYAKVVNDNSPNAWIRLDSSSVPAANQVQLQYWDLNHSVGYAANPGDFVGNASSTSGLFSFNCKSQSGGNCFSNNYHVYIGNLQIGHMSAPNWSYSDACNGQALRAVLKWYPKSGWDESGNYTQTAYQVVINSANSTSSPVFDSGKRTGSATQLICPGPNCGWTPNYNTNYYWWVRLWYNDTNNTEQVTEWYQFGTNDGHEGSSDEQTDGNPDGNIQTFTTYKHEFPTPYFSWSPFDILVGTSTVFTSTGDPNNSGRSCYTAGCNFLWTTGGDPDARFDGSLTATTSTNHPTTSIIFKHTTSTNGIFVNLFVTDSDSYTCSTSSLLTINFDLPIWREVRAE